MPLSKLSRSISGSVAVVTGAASGMGRATAHLFGDEGARVALLDVNNVALEKVHEEMNGEGYDSKAWCVDLSDELSIKRVFSEISEHFGGIDILINNAGISRFAPIDDDDYEIAWHESIAVLLTAHTLTVRAALPHLRRAENPRIVNIASTEGLGATRYGSPYTAAWTQAAFNLNFHAL